MVFEEIPASPTAKLMRAPGYDLHILAIVGFMTTIDVDAFKKGVERTAAKHPRFSSVLVGNDKGAGNTTSWRRTKVDINNHVFKHNLDAVDDCTEESIAAADQMVEDFTSALSTTTMDLDKPLWEAHILNIKTSDATSTVIFRFHHSLGDGVSLVSLLLAAARRVDDPESLPVIPTKRSSGSGDGGGVWFLARVLSFLCWVFKVMFYTLADCALFIATLVSLKDSETLIKGGATKAELSRKRFVHRVVSLEDVKTIKNAMNVAVNDVLLGVADAGLTQYLNMRYADASKQSENGAETDKKQRKAYLPKNIFLRSAVVFNLRPSATIEDLAEMMEKDQVTYEDWGNLVGIILLPFTMSLQDDPLTYIRKAKSVMDRKKLSLGPKCSSLSMKLMVNWLFGVEATASLTSRVFKHTTLTFSSVIGPRDEVSLYGHPVCYIAPSVYGFPQSLIIHYQSYANKLIISVGADEKLIPNPHQLCDDLVKSIERVKEAVINKGLVSQGHY